MSFLLGLIVISVILLTGIVCSSFSERLKIPHVILFLSAGFLFSLLFGDSNPIPASLLSGICVFSVIIFLFGISSRLQFKTMDTLSLRGIRFSVLSLIFNIIFFSLAFLFFYRPEENAILASVIAAVIFSILISSSDFPYSSFVLRGFKAGILKILETESYIINIFSAVLPFLIIDFFYNTRNSYFFGLNIGPILSFIAQIAVGIGSGLFIGLITFKILSKSRSKGFRYISWVISSLLVYGISESINGSGLLAVVSLGFVFGNFVIKNDHRSDSIESIINSSTESIVFFLLGFSLVVTDFYQSFLIPFMLFFVYLIIRYISVEISFNKTYSFKDKLFMVSNISKGPLIVSVALLLSTKGIHFMSNILPSLIPFLIISVIFYNLVCSKKWNMNIAKL